MNSYGIWKVTATLKDEPWFEFLGYYEGYIDHTALHLGNDSYNYLDFEQVETKVAGCDNIDEIKIRIEVPPVEREVYFKPIDPAKLPGNCRSQFEAFIDDTFGDRDCMIDVEVLPDNFVKISRKLTAAQKAKKRLNKILDKYPEDKDEIIKLIEDLKGDDNE